MNRRTFLCAAAASAALHASPPPLVVPVHRLMDSRAKCAPEILHNFWWKTWKQAARDFGRCGIELRTSDATGEIRLSPGDKPRFTGLQPGVINMVLTDRLPMRWDKAKALAGVTTLHEGFHLCVIALRYAHPHRCPYISVNTCVHELLHALLLDIYIDRPKWYQVGVRETRDDFLATRLWLFGHGTEIRESTRAYLARLRRGR